MVSAKHPRLRLQHMLETIDGILDATAGLSFETIADDFVLIRATERALQNLFGLPFFPMISPHPEVLRSSLEGALQRSPCVLEGSFEADASRRHLRMRGEGWIDRSVPVDH